MAKQAPKRAPRSKAAPKAAPKAEAKPAQVAQAKTSTYQMLHSGVAEGASGAKYSYSKGDLVETPAGDLDHLGLRYCEKK